MLKEALVLKKLLVSSKKNKISSTEKLGNCHMVIPLLETQDYIRE